MPSQKPGTAMKRTDSVRAMPSGMLLGLNALRMPTGSPTSQETTRARTPISALIGPRCRISSATVSPRKNDRRDGPPRCRRSADVLQRQRITEPEVGHDAHAVGRRHPRVAFDPENGDQRVPGRTRRTTKMITETPKAYRRRTRPGE